MRPIFKNRFINGLGRVQIFSAVFRNAIEKNVMVATLYNTDGVDLNVTQMSHGIFDSVRAFSKRRLFIEPMCANPNILCFIFINFNQHAIEENVAVPLPNFNLKQNKKFNLRKLQY